MAVVIVPVGHTSQVGEARRVAVALAAGLRLTGEQSGRVALIATELATNLVKHAGEGEILIWPIECAGVSGVEMLSIDSGPGIANIQRSLRDGYSTSGSSGTGLGAIARLSSRFDAYSEVGHGTVVMSRFWAGELRNNLPPRPLEIGAICVPVKGEAECGDGWAVEQSARRSVLLVSDGIGHGSEACQATRAAIGIFRAHWTTGSPRQIVEAIHAGLRATRGAAIFVAEVDHADKLVRCAGLGNVTGRIVCRDQERTVQTDNGTAGHEMRKINEHSYPWDEDAVFVIQSDGIGTHWTLSDRPQLTSRHPSIVSGVIHRDLRRGRDDSTVLTARRARGGLGPGLQPGGVR